MTRPTRDEERDEVPRHLRLAIDNATRAFERADLGALATINETIQPLVDAAFAFHFRQSSSLRGLWQGQRDEIGRLIDAEEAHKAEVLRARSEGVAEGVEKAAKRMEARAADLRACGNLTGATMARVYDDEAAGIRTLTPGETPDGR